VARFWKDRHDQSAELNCGLVNQNVLLIQRNTRMEAVLTQMGVDYPTRETFEPPSVTKPSDRALEEKDPRRDLNS
jgi:hypothetical protein